MNSFLSARAAARGQLDDEALRGLDLAIDRSNWLRLRYFFVLTMVFELALMIAVDAPALARAGASDATLPWGYLVCHLGIFVTAGLGVWAAFRSLRGTSHARVSTLAPGLYAMVVLVFLGVITDLDQLRGGDINAFTINMLVAAAFLYLRPPLAVLVFTPGFLIMFVGIAVLQSDPVLRLANLVNSGILYTAVLLISMYLYNNQFSQLAKSSLLERANARIRELSARDELTGLYNRRAFVDLVETERARQRREGRRLYLAMADIDHFKRLNDTYGHPAGDAILRHVARVLSDSLRATDTVARWGGEEFLLLFEADHADEGLQLLERTRQAVEAASMDHAGRSLSCTISLGVAELVNEPEAFTRAYQRADAALYAAKEAGRNRVKGANL